ncbi:MAG: Glu-tRNA(Gln) amidotransferase subunit GatE [Candidatus Bathyarchaeota archaeon]|nr:MAG: Glu-tRNA(Gln) amidotransferase subunit GatE [Candidatus Bathyarchaeota archaeon]
MDYSKIGLKVGIEIHQQLKTDEKLFCSCKPDLVSSEPSISFYRKLRPTQSELGKIDPAASFEFKRGRGFVYDADKKTTCLVEMDEEPPHRLNEEALDICLIIALMINAKIVDEAHVMRKIVIDGSNTTGFQRTCIIALGGEITVNNTRCPLQTVCLEEDAARKIREKGLIVQYKLDRLCVPLIEITTAPAIHTPEEARKVALAIGSILRATKRVKRGLGTIRQDLNISIRDGALIEVKGVQELELVSKVVEYEVNRQVALLKIKNELSKRRVEFETIINHFVDVTGFFDQTTCKTFQNAIARNGRVLALVLPNFGGLLGIELIPNIRFGTELSDYAKFWGKVGGIIHTDELTVHKITEEEINNVKRFLNAGRKDAIIFVADHIEKAHEGLNAVVARAKQALKGVPSETRRAYLDATTRYSRPRPGAARMYPETDVPPVPISIERLSSAKQHMPKLPDEVIFRLMKEYGLNQKLANQLYNSDYLAVFERIAHTSQVAPTFIAAVLTETFKGLKREGFAVESLSELFIETLFELVDSKRIAKEAISQVIAWSIKNDETDLDKVLRALGLEMISTQKLEKILSKIIDENETLIYNRKIMAIGPLMGIIMSEFRGKVDAKMVNQLLKEKIKEKLMKEDTNKKQGKGVLPNSV